MNNSQKLTKILIAEDDMFLANAYRVKLSKLDYEVQIASDGEEVFEKLNTFLPDLILLDLIMPRLDGFGVLERLQTLKKFSKVPVIVASNLGQDQDITKAEALGAIDYVVKSDLSLDDLIEKINGNLKK